MQNVRKSQLKKCIFLTIDEFREVVTKFFGDDTTVEAGWDGIYLEANEDALCTSEVLAGLAKHFGVNEVTSYHIDDFEEIGVWIVYKEAEDGNV